MPKYQNAGLGFASPLLNGLSHAENIIHRGVAILTPLIDIQLQIVVFWRGGGTKNECNLNQLVISHKAILMQT